MKALVDQHCGKPVVHPPHGHTAHARAKVSLCTCELDPCICTSDLLVRDPGPKQAFHCDGKMVVEGLEAPKKRGEQP